MSAISTAMLAWLLGCRISIVDIERRSDDEPLAAGVESTKKFIFFSSLGEETGETLPTLDASVAGYSTQRGRLALTF